MNLVKVANYTVGAGQPLLLIAGPCVLEGYERSLLIGRRTKAIAEELGLPYVFKASFDKANRSSYASFRGPGLKEGLAILAQIKKDLQVPVITDIHEPYQAEEAAQVVDVLQIPAFLCRQTDLVWAAAKTGKAVNVKKGQFLAPWDMKNVIKKEFAPHRARLKLRLQHAGDGYAGLGDHERAGLPGGDGRHSQRADPRRAGNFQRRPEPICAPHGSGGGGGRHRRSLLGGPQ